MPTTLEQADIIKKVIQFKKNIVIIAKAGCGKTATLLLLAEHFPSDAKIILITYNKKLRKDTIKRASALGLDDRIECHTFHSLTLAYYLNVKERNDFRDSLIHDSLSKNLKSQCQVSLKHVSAVFLDECQDISEESGELVKKFVKDIYISSLQKPQLVICGDPFQRIYPFRKTTLDYILQPDKHFSSLVTDSKFETCRLSHSFRITPPMATWINQYLNPKHLEEFFAPEKWSEIKEQLLSWWGDGIHSAKPLTTLDGEKINYPPVGYLTLKNWDFKKLALQIKPYYDQYKMSEITLLSFSSKTKNAPVYKLINAITDFAKPKQINWIYYFNDQEEEEKENKNPSILLDNPIASSIHQQRGIDNKVVIVFGLDAFFEKCSENILDLFCLNYVAATRGWEKLIIIQCHKEPFLTVRKAQLSKSPKNKKKVTMSSNIELFYKRALRYKKNGLKISDMYAFVPYDAKLDQQFTEMIQIYKLPPAEMKVSVLDEKLGAGENLSKLYTLAIELALYSFLQNLSFIQSFSFFAFATSELKEISDFLHTNKNKSIWIDRINHLVDWPFLIQVANASQTLNSKLLYKWRRLKNYENWVPSSFLQSILTNCIKLVNHLYPQISFKFHFYSPILHSFCFETSSSSTIKFNLHQEVYFQTNNAFLYFNLNFNNSQQTDNLENLVAFATSALYHLENPIQTKLTYILNPQLGTISKMVAPFGQAEKKEYLLACIARKLDIPQTYLSVFTNPLRKKKES